MAAVGAGAKSYIHPAILDAYTDGATIQTVPSHARMRREEGGLDDTEAAVVALISSRLRRKAA
jgi:DNA topoisomerase IB